MALSKKRVFFFIVLFFFCFSPALFAQQAAQSSVTLPPAVVSQSLDVFDTSASSGVLTGKVTAVSGSVKLRNVRTIFWEDMLMGQEVKEGDNIKTEKDGQVKIEFANGNVLFLRANSQILIKTLNTDNESGKYDTVIKTNKARIKAEVNDRDHLKTFEIHTPVVVAGARGTVFYVNVTPKFSEVFVEKGTVAVRNTISGREREIPSGLATTSDKTGKVAEPAAPPAEKLQEFQAAWEPPMLPSPTGPNGEPLKPPPPPGTLPPPPPGTPLPQQIVLTDIVKNMESQQLTTAVNDRTTSQSADMTNYINNPPPPANDFDMDWLNDTEEINIYHTLTTTKDTDNDGLTDWDEAKIEGSSPVKIDSDLDGANDRDDAFPNNSGMADTRTYLYDERYNKVRSAWSPPGASASAQRNSMRVEIDNLLSDASERQKDYWMDRVSDAQMHKVLKDSTNNWVRMEEYVFRPASNKISILNLTYHQNGGYLRTMQWDTMFNHSLDGLTSKQIRDLPWNTYLSSSPQYGATAPLHYPLKMSVTFASPNDSGHELAIIKNYSNPTGTTLFSQSSSELISGSIPGNSFVSSANPWVNNITFVGSLSSGRATFNYNWAGGPFTAAYFDLYMIDGMSGSPISTFDSNTNTFNSIWDVMGANLPGFTNNHYIEIRVSFYSKNWTVIYAPIRNLTWRGTTEWEPQLTW